MSVVLCTYNQREYVRDAVESVLGQTHPNMELILIDNGSTDGSRELLAGYSARADVQLLLFEENATLDSRMNEGIAVATGEYISILYGDDYYLPEKTERQLECFSRLGPEYGVVHSPGYRLDVSTRERWVERRLESSGNVLPELLRRYHEVIVNPISPLVHRACFERYPFDESIFAEGEDHYLFIAQGYLFQYLDEPLVVMREHATNLGKAYLRNYESAVQVLDALARSPELPGELMGEIARAKRLLRRRVGWALVRVGAEPEVARRMLREAIADSPGGKTLLGYALTLLPDRLRSVANGAINAIRRPRGGLEYRRERR